MTNPEIEKLANEYVVSNMKSFMEENLTYTDAFKAGYLKGVEKAIEICELYMNPNNKFVAEIFDVKEALEQLLSSEGEK